MSPPTKPAYVVHHVDEADVTVDWFFGPRSFAKKLPQLLLVLVGWFFAILPIVITASALIHRHDPAGWWNYPEGFAMWDATIATLGILFVFFLVAFLALYLAGRSTARRRRHTIAYDEAGLAERLEVATALYTSKYGPEELRRQQRNVRIEPYGDFETYELRDRYRTYGLD